MREEEFLLGADEDLLRANIKVLWEASGRLEARLGERNRRLREMIHGPLAVYADEIVLYAALRYDDDTGRMIQLRRADGLLGWRLPIRAEPRGLCLHLWWRSGEKRDLVALDDWDAIPFREDEEFEDD